MRYAFIFLIIIAIFIVLNQIQSTRPQTLNLPNNQKAVLGKQSKTSGCIATNGKQDEACTPGDVFPDATIDQICQSGYSKSVRNVSAETKKEVYSEYRITYHHSGEYEVDHLISLELGGSNDISNLWPEAAEPRPGFHEKDVVENYLHYMVCNKGMDLKAAQNAIATDWLSIYKQIPDPSKFEYKGGN